MLRILPGDVAAVMAGVNSPPERVAQLRAELGLDRPLAVQYLDWCANLLHGDLGASMLTGRSVSEQVGVRAAITFPLIAFGLLIALVIGIPLGCAATLARGHRARAAYRLISIIGGAIPALWSGMLLILLFGRGVGLVGILQIGRASCRERV